MLSFTVVEKAWWQELDLAGYRDIHSIRKQKKITTDTRSSFYMFQDPTHAMILTTVGVGLLN